MLKLFDLLVVGSVKQQLFNMCGLQTVSAQGHEDVPQFLRGQLQMRYENSWTGQPNLIRHGFSTFSMGNSHTVATAANTYSTSLTYSYTSASHQTTNLTQPRAQSRWLHSNTTQLILTSIVGLFMGENLNHVFLFKVLGQESGLWKRDWHI